MKKHLLHLITLLLLTLLIQGCFEAALTGGALVGGITVLDKRPGSVILDDQNISHQIQKKIVDDKSLNQSSHIVVATFNHNVLLAGQAPNKQLKDQAYLIARSTSKVKNIFNEIAIAAPTSALKRSSDSWITTKAKTQMLATKYLHSGQIKVVTEDGTLYLMGIVNRKQGDLATQVVREIAGVQKVVKLFEYTQS